MRDVLYREAVLVLLGVRQDKRKPALQRRNQVIGEYCQEKYTIKCEQYFGKVLDQVCATCPN